MFYYLLNFNYHLNFKAGNIIHFKYIYIYVYFSSFILLVINLSFTKISNSIVDLRIYLFDTINVQYTSNLSPSS